MKTDLLAKKVEIKRQLSIIKARENFFTFLKVMFPINTVTWNWHHKYVCSVLQDFALGNIPFLMIFMPPQHQKSTMMTEYLPAFILGLNPDDQIILTMYNATKSAEYNRKIQRIIDSPTYREIFPDTNLNSKNVVSSSQGSYVRNSEKFEIVGRQGFLYSVGVDGGIAGTPAKTALMDDVIKNVAEASSKRYRDKVYEWYTDELEARLHNDSKVAFTITRRHEDDLAGRLIERDGKVEDGGKWKVIVLPALREDMDNLNDPRKIGGALFPKLHSQQRMEEIKIKNPRTFASLYQQRPSAGEGNTIKPEWFNVINQVDVPFGVYPKYYLDAADTKKQKNDPSVLIEYYKIGKKVVITYIWRFWMEFTERVDHIEDCIKDPNARLYVEPKSSGKSIVSYLRKYTKILVYEDVAPTDSKEVRAEAITPFIERGLVDVLDEEWNRNFFDECKVFPKGKHDDQVDCLSAICRIEFLEGYQGEGDPYGESYVG